MILHSAALILDSFTADIVSIGTRGELCLKGYNSCKEYLHNREKTDGAMRYDRQGLRWMHTDDECHFADDDYCHINGRMEDIIVRGEENIYRAKVEPNLHRIPKSTKRACWELLMSDMVR